MDRFGFEVAESHFSINLLGFNGIVDLASNIFRLVGQCLEQLLEIKRISIGDFAVIRSQPTPNPLTGSSCLRATPILGRSDLAHV